MRQEMILLLDEILSKVHIQNADILLSAIIIADQYYSTVESEESYEDTLLTYLSASFIALKLKEHVKQIPNLNVFAIKF